MAPGQVAVVLALLFGLATTGISAITVTLPALADDLSVGAAASTWVVSGYAVALAVGTAVHGRVADLVGIRAPLVVGVLLMACGALVSSAASTFPMLLAGRVLQGAGAAAVPVLATALVIERWDGPVRAGALARVVGAGAAVNSLGPLIGGGLAAAAGGWRWTMALPVVGLLAVPVIWRTAPAAGTPGRLDVPGALLVAGASSGLVLLIQSPAAGVAVAWVGAGLLALAAPALVVWVRARPNGFLPRAVVTNGVVLRHSFAAAAVPAGWFALLVAVPLALAERGWSPLGVGLVLVPSAFAALVMPRATGALLPRLGATRALTVAGLTVGLALLVAAAGALVGVPAMLVVAVVLVTVAFGLGQPALITAVGDAVLEEQRGVAIGVATLIILVGAGVGSATIGGLAEPLGLGAALAVLALLPAAGTTVLLAHRHAVEQPPSATQLAPPPC